MIVKPIIDTSKEDLNKVASHPLQTYEWGEFREKTGVEVIRIGFYEKNTILEGFQMTIHKIPHLPWTIGYIPKSALPTKEMMEQLYSLGKKYNCIFVQIEPNCKKELGEKSLQALLQNTQVTLRESAHPLFTKYTFQLDLTPSENELLQHMHHKTRYNIRIAQKHGVVVKEEVSDEAFRAYLSLTQETTNRQRFYAHSPTYHRLMWQVLGKQKKQHGLSAHLFIAYYTPPGQTESIPLTAWMLFKFKDALYYPYGASSSHYKEVMSSNLMMWETILFGKRLGLKVFDMWGALGENPNKQDSWYGFHKFKMGYGPKHTEFIGSFDIVINPFRYELYKIANKLRWQLLKFCK